jgi:FkbM family methyltransferase
MNTPEIIDSILNAKIEPFDAVLALLENQPSVSIVQLGAYIGKTRNDPLVHFLRTIVHAKESSQVVLVEPIRDYFDLLCENYQGISHVALENVAIAETDDDRIMYRLGVDPANYEFSEWLAQLSSLKKERLGYLWENYEGRNGRHTVNHQFCLKHRVTETVKCMTLHQLLDKHEIQHLDILQIDTEGYEFEILQTLDFKKIKPRFINYERVLLREYEPECREMMEAAGYLLVDWGTDTLCILKGRDENS